MKKLFILPLLVFSISALAQDMELNQDGAYEKIEVVAVDGASSIILFERAIEALSDWAGPDGRSKAGIDYSEKETGTVIYKGKFSLGFKNVIFGQGWSRFADFTMKIRCKDGRAQITVTVPTISGVYSATGQTASSTLPDLIEAVKKAKGNKHERGLALIETMKESVDILIESMKTKLQTAPNDDF